MLKQPNLLKYKYWGYFKHKLRIGNWNPKLAANSVASCQFANVQLALNRTKDTANQCKITSFHVLTSFHIKQTHFPPENFPTLPHSSNRQPALRTGNWLSTDQTTLPIIAKSLVFMF